MYTQNNEEQIILDYFRDKKGVFLDIGANDGKTFSNSLALMERGWEGVLVEPSPKAFTKLEELYKQRFKEDKYYLFNYCISEKDAIVKFNESGSFDHTGNDVALLSCIDPKEKQRWGDRVAFEEIEVDSLTFDSFVSYYWVMSEKSYDSLKFDFISIDAEGMDWQILKQIDLNKIHCSMFCIEHNGIEDLIIKYRDYANSFGMSEVLKNAENLIFAR